MPVFQVGFHVVALGPFVPRFQKNKGILVVSVLNKAQYLGCVFFQQIRGVVVHDETFTSCTRTMVPSGDNGRIDAGVGIQGVVEKLHGVFVLECSWRQDVSCQFIEYLLSQRYPVFKIAVEVFEADG